MPSRDMSNFFGGWLKIVGSALLVIVMVAVSLSGVACERQEATGKLKVVVTIFPLADFVRNVAREKAEVVTLLRAGDSPHTYDPLPDDVKAVADARLLIINGAGLDFWVEKVKAAASPNLMVVDTSVILAMEGMLLAGNGHGEDDEHEGHGEVNPHFWLDPVLARKQVEAIAAALIMVDPENKDFYLKNAIEYVEELESLDEEIMEVTQAFSSREFITFHPAWTYFARRYGLVEAAVIEEAPGKEPSAEYVKHVIDVAKQLRIGVIFAEPQFSDRAAQAIADGCGAKVLFLDPIGGPGLQGRDSYIALMRYNLAQMQEAMG